ncbi:MAG: hypothetical protein ACYTGN_10060 [Planctomycetota bacterium]|jgi:hypothetical protein
MALVRRHPRLFFWATFLLVPVLLGLLTSPLVPFAGADDDDDDDGIGLKQRVETLESLVESLQDDLADAEDRIADLEAVPAEDLTIVRGTVLFNGSIFAGDGFTVTHVAEGEYLVIYDSGTFSAHPTVLVQSLGSDQTIATVDSETATGFTVETTSGSNLSFRFVAVGPR